MATDLTGPSHDPTRPVILQTAAGVVVGFVAIALGWAGASRQLVTAAEVPWLVSGGFAGVAISGISIALLAVTVRRRALARELVLLETAAELAGQLRRLQ